MRGLGSLGVLDFGLNCLGVEGFGGLSGSVRLGVCEFMGLRGLFRV